MKLSTGKEIPISMYKARMVQKIWLTSVELRLRALEEAGYNTFLLKTDSIFLDMLTDSGVNAMSDKQFAGMIKADDAYAGSMSRKILSVLSKNVLYPSSSRALSRNSAEVNQIF